jgi:putative sigma-54 modulation protein
LAASRHELEWAGLTQAADPARVGPAALTVSRREDVMRLEIRHQGVEVTDGLRDSISERFKLALGRFARSIAGLRVYLRDVNGPRGGTDKECRVVAEVPRDGRVVVTGAAADVTTAVARTAYRAGYAVRSHLKRRLARRRPSRRRTGSGFGSPREDLRLVEEVGGPR